MKIKNIIPIFMALTVVACSATGNNNSSSSGGGGTTTPPVDVTTLERLDFDAFDAILEGEVRGRVNNPTLLTGDNLRVYSARDGFGSGLRLDAVTIGNTGNVRDRLDNIRANVYTNDLVEKLYIKVDSTGTALSFAKLSATVGRGMFPTRATVTSPANNIQLPFANEIVELYLLQQTGLTEVTPVPNIFLDANDSNTERFTVPSGFRFYTSPTPESSIATRRNSPRFLSGAFGEWTDYQNFGAVNAFLIRVTDDNAEIILIRNLTAQVSLGFNQYVISGSDEGRARVFGTRDR